MSRSRIGAALALLALALLTLPAGASGDSSNPTWAGTWDSDFGEMTLDAGGSGNYVSPYGAGSSGTISGNVDGRVNRARGSNPTRAEVQVHDERQRVVVHRRLGVRQRRLRVVLRLERDCNEGACLENDDRPPAQPPRCGGPRRRAFVAAKTATSARCRSAQRVQVDLRRARVKTKDISPKARRPAGEVQAVILEILAEQEAERMVAAIAAKFEAKERRPISGCFVVMGGSRGSLADRVPSEVSNGAALPSSTPAHGCCYRPKPARRPAGTARRGRLQGGHHGARLRKGNKVTKRMRKRDGAAIRERVKASCEASGRGSPAVALNARRKGATMNERDRPTAPAQRRAGRAPRGRPLSAARSALAGP